jgi:glycine cleavage system H protein
MKEIHELDIPEDLRFAKEHEWVRLEKDCVRVGISDYAQNQLGDVVYVELPQVGQRFERKEPFGSIEAVKAVSELYMPVGGEIIEINSALEVAPELVNQSPYEKGWLILVRPADDSQMALLMTRNEYIDMLKGLDH